MPKERTSVIAAVIENQVSGISIVKTPDKAVKYDVAQLKVMSGE
jgi:hypothetical protein